jgi:hypothetical protein
MVLDQLRALDAAQKLIRTRINPADLMAIMEYNGAAVEVLQDFSGGRRGCKRLSRLSSQARPIIRQINARCHRVGYGSLVRSGRHRVYYFQRWSQIGCSYFDGGLTLSGIDNPAQLRAAIDERFFLAVRA